MKKMKFYYNIFAFIEFHAKIQSVSFMNLISFDDEKNRQKKSG